MATAGGVTSGPRAREGRAGVAHRAIDRPWRVGPVHGRGLVGTSTVVEGPGSLRLVRTPPSPRPTSLPLAPRQIESVRRRPRPSVAPPVPARLNRRLPPLAALARRPGGHCGISACREAGVREAVAYLLPSDFRRPPPVRLDCSSTCMHRGAVSGGGTSARRCARQSGRRTAAVRVSCGSGAMPSTTMSCWRLPTAGCGMGVHPPHWQPATRRILSIRRG